VIYCPNHDPAWLALGRPWSSVADPGQLWATGWSEVLSGKPTYFDDGLQQSLVTGLHPLKLTQLR